jgi:predicted house-cleaning noncanonical NTP pyrophosphatase (MazG superfamily)
MAVKSNSGREPLSQHRQKLPERKLTPLNAITYIDSTGLVRLAPEAVHFETVGWKAYGLSCLPLEWVPRFLVISEDCFKDLHAQQKLRELLKHGISQAGINGSVKIRSSGTEETIHNRGRLISGQCAPDEIVDTIAGCISRSSDSIKGEVHWIVQELLQSERQGHLSNERHVSKEKRDWVAELELREQAPGYSIPIAVRRWRDGDRVSDFSLNCKSELEISFCLKRVALWAERSISRMHFEWVWNGSVIRIVQAEFAERVTGVDPHSLLLGPVSNLIIKRLSAFRPAASLQFERYPKLRNAKLYKRLGYTMPSFYVLDDAGELSAILSGTITAAVESDLVELTKRPLILRTDGDDIPVNKSEMLPRSDTLLTPYEVKEWLLGPFRSKVQQSGLQESSLCLIGHHFIPSISSAWARAEPGQRFVRIEALWGVPEGLYWYSHDTFEVDTQDVEVQPRKRGTTLNYTSSERLRYKGTFVAPDETGKWIANQTKPPFDWRPSINKQNWLFEIAQTTRLVAEREKNPIAVMWLIGNHPKATSHSVLPWFHVRSDLERIPKAAPRRKLTTAKDFKLHTGADWTELRSQVAAGQVIERVVVQPTDCELIRNRGFAEDLGKFVVPNNIVIELAGGVLTHAYYILQREGAQIECTDLFGTQEDVVEYNKLVRDRVPAIISGRGEKVEVVQLSGDALTSALRQKLIEEALEALDAKSGDDLIGELADVQEVISGLCHALRISNSQIEVARSDKERRRGGFQRGFMLRKTSTPHSLQKQVSVAEATLTLDSIESENIVISRSSDIPSTQTYRRPDLRKVEEEVEKLFVFATEINRMTNSAETVNFSLPIDRGNSRAFSLTVEIRRNGASLRSIVRLRLRPSQLLIDFPNSQLELDFSNMIVATKPKE